MKKSEYETLSKNDRANFTLEGEAFWAHIHKPDMHSAKKFNAPPKFAITLLLDDENKKKAVKHGLKVKPADEFNAKPYIVLKRNSTKTIKNDDGSMKEVPVKIEVVDSMQKPIPPNILIGNGSHVVVKCSLAWLDSLNKVHPYLTKVQVRKLVEYKAAGSSEVDKVVEGGYKTPDEFDEELPF